MTKLIQRIEEIRQKLHTLRRHGLKETPTRTIIIDPILESLGWNVRDPDEVLLEYPTIDGKSVDYALMINRKPALLVEAKQLDDAIDVKAITQIVGYAANNGIMWCVLTNGVKWRIYRSMEQCAAPEKLMYEVSIDPNDSEGMTVEQVAKQLWRLSADEMAKGTLDTLGEQTFTDGKVRKAIQTLMTDSPNTFVRLIRKTINDDNLTPKRIRDSLTRLAREDASTEPVVKSTAIKGTESLDGKAASRSTSAKRAGATRRRWAASTGKPIDYGESHHLDGKPQEVVQLYRALDRLCMSLDPRGVRRRSLARLFTYDYDEQIFCSIILLQSGIRVRVALKLQEIENPPSFARDISGIGRRRRGMDVELRISNRAELDEAADLIRRAFETVK